MMILTNGIKMMKIKRIRFNKLIIPDFQLKFAFSFLLPMLMASIGFWIMIELFIKKMIDLGKQQNLPVNHDYFQLLEIQRIELLTSLLIFSIILAIVFLVWGVIYSHRIAGPLYKLRKWLQETSTLEGALERPVVFRKNDFFKEISSAVNEFIEKVKR
jgi:methyl-accepting chemotaxis protein